MSMPDKPFSISPKMATSPGRTGVVRFAGFRLITAMNSATVFALSQGTHHREHRNPSLRDRREITQPVVGELLDNVGRDTNARDGGIDKRIAVGGRILRRLGADDAIRARLVLYYYRLSKRGPQPVGKVARHDIGYAARRVRHDQTNGLRGPRLRERGKLKSPRSMPRSRKSAACSNFSLANAERRREAFVQLILLTHELLGLGGRADRGDAADPRVAGQPVGI